MSSRGMALVQMRYAAQAVNAQRYLDQVSSAQDIVGYETTGSTATRGGTWNFV